MLSRYTIYRRRPADAGPLPDGIRQDARHSTSHILRPNEAMVETYLADPSNAAWRKFKKEFLALLEKRFREDREPFDDLAALAKDNDVYIGCNCPTKKNPTPGHCHTFAALEFMKKHYRRLKVLVPKAPAT